MNNFNNRKIRANEVYVQNADGEIISVAFANRALKLVSRNKAIVVCEEPLTIRLLEQVEVGYDTK